MKWSISGPELSGGPTVLTALESISERLRFGDRTFQIANFLGYIHVAGLYAATHVGVQAQIYCTGGASLLRLIGNFPTVHLRLKSVTEMADFGPGTFWRPPMYPPRIHVEKGAIRGPSLPNSQLSGTYPRAGPPCCQTRWRPGDKILPGRGVSPSTHRQLPDCTYMAHIGYWNGRFWFPNFLAPPAFPTHPIIRGERAIFGARTFQIPNFLRNIHVERRALEITSIVNIFHSARIHLDRRSYRRASDGGVWPSGGLRKTPPSAGNMPYTG